MDTRPLIELIEEVAARLKSVQKERDEAVSRNLFLETEVAKQNALISAAESALQSILASEPKPDQRPPEKPPSSSSKPFTGFDEFAADPKRQSREQ